MIELNGTMVSFLNPLFLKALFSIILIDIVLAGDNAVVIAMAVQSLEANKKKWGIIFGSLAAVLLRVIFTFFAAQMLSMPVVKLAGGALILWIAVKLLVDNSQHAELKNKAASVWQAVWIIIIADVTMSLDNILAVAGASHGNAALLIFGFGLSIPLVVFASSMISRLMEKYPIVIWVGAAILGHVGAGMMVRDIVVVKYLLVPYNLTIMKHAIPAPDEHLALAVEIIGVIGVILAALAVRRQHRRRSAMNKKVLV